MPSAKQSMQALADDQHKVLFLTLATRCTSVVCCRVSPMQKALVTKLVREGLGVMTLAVGDGANDVSMIQVRVGLVMDLVGERLSVMLHRLRTLASVSRVKKACRR